LDPGLAVSPEVWQSHYFLNTSAQSHASHSGTALPAAGRSRVGQAVHPLFGGIVAVSNLKSNVKSHVAIPTHPHNQYKCQIQLLQDHAQGRLHIHQGDILRTNIDRIWEQAGASKCDWTDQVRHFAKKYRTTYSAFPL
jgi:hypothetical protein